MPKVLKGKDYYILFLGVATHITMAKNYVDSSESRNRTVMHAS